ncbi:MULTISPECIES: hypothetical protein [Okeania]|uniref:hypothetical protein n=1 Tax=Okeania TaxID=1458928 RepID=UPI001960AA75|nr:MULTISPECIES: hypothetical protein [Okeania]
MINGRPLKSINQYYNKVQSFLQSQLQENKSSKRLKKLCIEEGDRRQETGDRRKITWGF